MRRHVLLVSLALAVALGGCAGLLGGGGGDVDPETVGERVDDRLETVETLSGTVIYNGGTDESPPFRLAVTYERPDRIRVRFLNGSMAGTRVVSNGSVTYRYDPEENVVSVVEGAYVEDIEDLLFGAASLRPNATFEGNETLAGEDAVELSYRDGRDLLEVVVLDRRPPFFDTGDRIRVAGREALFVDHPEGRIVEWQCSGTLRMVAGPTDFDREGLVSVAQSVGCSG